MSIKDLVVGTDGLTRRAAFIAAARMLALMMAFLLPLALVRLLSQTDFGVYKQLFLILNTTTSLLGLQVAASAYYFMPREPARKSQVATNVVVFYLGVGSLAALLFVFFPGWAGAVFNNADIVPHIPLLGLAVLLWLVSSNLEVLAIANGDIRAATTFIVVVQVVKSALLLTAALAAQNVGALVLAAAVQGGLQCLILFAYLVARFGKFWQSFDWPFFKIQIANALPFGLGSIVFFLQADLHHYFVSYYFDPATFAIYAVGCFQLPVLLLLVDSVTSVLIPEVSRLEKEKDYRSIARIWTGAMSKLALFFIPAYAYLVVMASEFITVLFTKDYSAAVPIFTINITTILLNIIVAGPILRAFDHCKYFRLKLYLVLLPVTWAALYFGIQWAGLLGAITSVVVIQTLGVTLTAAKVWKTLNLKAGDLSSLAPILRTVGLAGVAGLATFLVRDSLPLAELEPLQTLVICSSVFALVYGVGLLRSLWPAFAGVFLFVLLTYARPNDLFPILGSFPLTEIVGITTIAAYFAAKIARGERLTIWPVELKMLIAIVALSVLFMPFAASSADTVLVLKDSLLKVLVVFFLMINLIDTREKLRALLKLVVICGTAIALGAIQSYVAGNFADKGIRIAGPVGGVFGNANDLATALDLLIPIALVLAFTSGGLARLGYLLCSIVLTVGVIVTFSRAGFLGLLVAGGVILWKTAKGYRAVTMTVASLALALLLMIAGGYASRLATIVHTEQDATGSAHSRAALLKRAAHVAAFHPVVGVGLGNFHTYSINEKRAHNAYLEIAAELGLAGLLAYLVILFAPLRWLRRIERGTEPAIREDAIQRERYYLSVGLQAVLFAYMVCSFFASIQYTWLLYYPVAYAIALRGFTSLQEAPSIVARRRPAAAPVRGVLWGQVNYVPAGEALRVNRTRG